MEQDSQLDGFALRDPTWKRALLVARGRLSISTQAWQLIKSGWYGQAEVQDFIKILSFSKLDPKCLIVAADMNTGDFEANAETLEKSITFLGVRLCSVVLAVNLACKKILKTKPPSLWRTLLEDMMSTIEIGYHIGAKCKEIGVEGGALMGFARGAGLGLLMAEDFDTYKKWHSMTAGFENRELQIEMFGCEAYQASAFAIQVLGFGAEAALGAALGTGKLNPKHSSYSRDILKWKAAFEWIEALRDGKSFPEVRTTKNFFPELVPPTGSEQNLNLEALQAEVAKVKRGGSSWLWHLPRPSYDDTTSFLSNEAKQEPK